MQTPSARMHLEKTTQSFSLCTRGVLLKHRVISIPAIPRSGISRVFFDWEWLDLAGSKLWLITMYVLQVALTQKLYFPIMIKLTFWWEQYMGANCASATVIPTIKDNI